MATVSTRYLQFDRLQSKGKEAAIVVKLMMAFNDLSLANQALEDWRSTTDRARVGRKRGAGMYFVRVELSHLHEALKVIRQLEESPHLRALVDHCSDEAQKSYAETLAHAHSGAKRARFEQLVGKMRHKVGFHYDETGKLIQWAIEDRAGRPEGNQTTITRTTGTHGWRFDVADDVVDSIVVRTFWQIPRTADLREQSDKIADEVHAVLVHFLGFAGEFIWKYCE